ncbi:GSCOCG00004760001-RA-CDS [Cotesia congregata]|nr:GSCOCG00004760001-RA-CDS [Cotesia congregata]
MHKHTRVNSGHQKTNLILSFTIQDVETRSWRFCGSEV